MSLKKPLKPKASSAHLPTRLRLPIGFQLEADFVGEGLVLGLDEVGRGCIAGPVCVAAVAFPTHFYHSPPSWMDEVVDSKLLSAKKREVLSEKIYAEALVCETLFGAPAEIDQLNILEATMKTFDDLLRRLASKHQVGLVLIDGNQTLRNPLWNQKAVISGDRVSRSIAAASIVAKVARDRLMLSLHEKYPHYDWAKNKGYGTKAHQLAMEQWGITSWHRRSFLKRKSLKEAGALAEKKARLYYQAKGFQILSENWSCSEGEIDFVASREKKLHFVEVRHRRDAQVDLAFPESKRIQMRRAANAFLRHYRVEEKELQMDCVLVSPNNLEVFWGEN